MLCPRLQKMTVYMYSVSLLLILESENRMRQSHVSVHDVSDTIGGDKLTEAGILCIPHPKLCGVSHINILGNILFSHIAGKPTLIRENVWCNCFNWQIENSRKIQGPKLIHLWTLFQDFLRGFVCVTISLRIKDWMDLMWFLPTGGINRVSQIS